MALSDLNLLKFSGFKFDKLVAYWIWTNNKNEVAPMLEKEESVQSNNKEQFKLIVSSSFPK